MNRRNTFSKQKAPIFNSARCTYCSEKVNTSGAFQDSQGQYWCNAHEKRGKLLMWASEHGYPAIQFLGTVRRCYPVQGLPDCARPAKYAIGIDRDKGNKELWEFSIMHGNDDMINAAIAYVGEIIARS